MKIKLTVSSIDKLHPQDKVFEVYDTDVQGLALRVLPSGNKTYYLRYRLESGERKRLKLGLHGPLKPPTARELALKTLAQVAHGEDPAKSRKQKKSGTDTLGGYIDKEYAPWALNHQKSGQKTIDMLHYAFGDVLKKKMIALSPLLIEKWKKGKIERGLKPRTINRYLEALQGALTKAVEWEFLDKSPLKSVKPLKADSPTNDRFLFEVEKINLFEALRERDSLIKQERRNGNLWKAQRGYDLLEDLDQVKFADHLEPMIRVSLHTGIRRNELFSLQWKEVDFSKKILSVSSSTSKTGKVRHIPMNKEVREVLSAWRKQCKGRTLVFEARNGVKFNNVKTAFSNILKRAKIENFRWHDQRHHFASQLVMKGVDINTVRELLGHSSINMTLRYAHLAPEHKMRAVEVLCDDNEIPFSA